MKTYFYYAGLMYAGYALLRTEADLYKILMLNMWIAIVVGGLGILQSFGGGGFLNPDGMAPELYELTHLTREAPQSHLITPRATSVFASDGRFGMFLSLLFIIGFGTAGYLLMRTKRGRKVVYFAIGVITLATLMSSSRGTNVTMLLDTIIMSLAMFWGAPWRQRQAFRMGKAIRWMVTFAGVAITLAVLFAPGEVAKRWAFYTETLSPSSATSELGYRAWEYPEKNLESIFEQPNWVTGNGTGISSLGRQYVTRLSGARPLVIGAESGYATLIIEFGILWPDFLDGLDAQSIRFIMEGCEKTETIGPVPHRIRNFLVRVHVVGSLHILRPERISELFDERVPLADHRRSIPPTGSSPGRTSAAGPG